MSAGWMRSLGAALILALVLNGAAARAAGIEAEAEVATALYAASATQAAAEKAADARISAERTQIAALAAKVRAGEAQRAQLIAAKQAFVAELAAKDRAYGEAIAVFRGAVVDICKTPEGLAAMARFNEGDEAGALDILDRIRAANDKTRQKREDIESAAEGRRIAELALEARARGKQTTAQVIARFEDVVRLDPGEFYDWVHLDQLYQDAGRLADAGRAIERGGKVARDERERTVALNELGDVRIAQGDLTGARSAEMESLAIARKLAAASPDDAVAARDVGVALEKVGEIQIKQGDLAAARATHEEELAIDRRLAAADPAALDRQRDVAISLSRVGDVTAAQGDLAAARADYEQSLVIMR